MFDGDYILYGKHAAYAKFLCKDRGQIRTDGVNVFDRIVDLVIAAPLVGVISDRYVEQNDNESEYKSDKSTVQYATVAQESKKLKETYRLVMLADDHNARSDVEKVSVAFKFDGVHDDDNPNMKIFNAYLRGGIEVLYERFMDVENQTGKKKNEWICGAIFDIVNEVSSSNIDLPEDLY